MNNIAHSLTEQIIQTMDPDRVRAVIELASAEGNQDIDKEASLVVTGVAIGVDETLTRIYSKTQEFLDFLGKVVSDIDEMLDVHAGTPAAQPLANIRTVLATKLQEVVDERKQSITSRMYSQYGINYEVVFGPNSSEDYEDLDLIGLGVEMLRRNPSAVLGWHYARTQGVPADMPCDCPQCYSQLWTNLQRSEELGLRQMVADSGGTDTAMKGFGAYLVDSARRSANRLLSNLPELHSVDARDAEESYMRLVAKFKKG